MAHGAHSLAGIGFAALSGVCFALSNLPLPAFYAGGGNVQIILIARFGAIALICAVLLRSQGLPLRLSPRQTLLAIVSGAVFGASSFLLLASFARIPVSLSILILYLFPIFTALIEAPFEGRWPRPLQMLLLIAALAGVGLALQIGVGDYDLIGVGMASLGALAVAVSFLCNDRWLKSAHTAAVSLHMGLTSVVLVILFATLTALPRVPATFGWDWLALLAALTLAPTAFLAMFKAVQLIGATPAAMLLNLEPVVTVLLATLLGFEHPTGWQYVGVAIVVAAILVSQWMEARRYASPAVDHGPVGPI